MPRKRKAPPLAGNDALSTEAADALATPEMILDYPMVRQPSIVPQHWNGVTSRRPFVMGEAQAAECYVCGLSFVYDTPFVGADGFPRHDFECVRPYASR